MAGVEVTFTVHPRPASDEQPPGDGLVTPVVPDASKLTIDAPADVTHHRDTLLGDLAFLLRYLLGRY